MDRCHSCFCLAVVQQTLTVSRICFCVLNVQRCSYEETSQMGSVSTLPFVLGDVMKFYKPYLRAVSYLR